MGAPIYLCQDNFTPTPTVALMWSDSGTTGSATLSQTGGQAVITLPSSTAGSHLGHFTTSGVYDLTGDDFVWNIGTMVATGVAATALFQLVNTAVGVLYWRQLSNTITARYTVGAVDTQLYTATWSSTTYKYLRISESGGTITFWSSTNGTSWTSRATVANPFAVTDLVVQFAASCGNVASPGSLKLDDVNLVLPAPSSTWRWTDADWSITNRLRPVTLASDGGKEGVIVTADSRDSSNVLGGTLHYYGGPLGSISGGYLGLTEYASLALAQASSFPIPIDGRVDLPAMVDARYMRLYHRSIDASAHPIREFVPRRIVQADDIEAESINAIHIVAHSIIADQIGTINLDANAQITAGAGAVTLNDQGISVYAEPTDVYNPQSAYTWYQADGVTPVGQLWAGYATTRDRVILLANEDIPNNRGGQLTLFASGTAAGNNADITLAAGRTGVASSVSISSPDTNGSILLNTPATTANGGLNVGTASGAGTGQISTSGNGTFGGNINGAIRLLATGVDATTSNYALYANNSASTVLLSVRNDGQVAIAPAAGSVGFFGSGGTTKQTVTGSRGGIAALTSLLTALASHGLLTNSSSA